VALTLLGSTGMLAKESEKEGIKPRMGPRKVLTQFDTNKNGKIEGTEAAELRKAFEGDLKTQLAKLDRDGNGKLDDAEISAIKVKAASASGGVTPPKRNGKGKTVTEGAPAQ